MTTTAPTLRAVHHLRRVTRYYAPGQLGWSLGLTVAIDRASEDHDLDAAIEARRLLDGAHPAIDAALAAVIDALRAEVAA